MKKLILNDTFGRTGNTMICLQNAIDYCLNKNISIIEFPNIQWQSSCVDTMLKSRKIYLIDNCKEDDNIDIESCSFIFFYKPMTTFERRIEIVHKYIRPVYNINPVKLDDNDLVILLRSGDVFHRPHYAYTQPPLSFYIEVIESKSWNKIYLLTEQKNNPCFEKLISKYDNIVHFLDDQTRINGNGHKFDDDFNHMIGCKNLIASSTSLSPFVIQMNLDIKNVYVPSFFFGPTKHGYRQENQTWWTSEFKNRKESFKCNDITFHIFDYDDYASEPDIWDYHKKENIDYLLNYKRS